MKCSVCKKEYLKSEFSCHQKKKSSSNRKCKYCSGQLIRPNVSKILLDWLISHGAQFPQLQILDISDEHRGVYATSTISKNKYIVKIPMCCIITTETVIHSDIGKKLTDLIDNTSVTFSEHNYLALYLLQERNNENSFWKPYLNMLPKRYENFPYFFNNDSKDKLEHTITWDMLLVREFSLNLQFSLLQTTFTELNMTLADYVWARIAVISRVFGIMVNGRKTEALVPLADMLNHKEDPGSSWQFENDSENFVIVANKFTAKHREIFDSYGPKCNSRYFVNYGFTLETNQSNNQTAVCLSQPDLCQNKMDMLSYPRSYDDGYSGYNTTILSKVKGEEIKSQYRFQISRLSDSTTLYKEKTIINDQHANQCFFDFLRIVEANSKEMMQMDYNINKEYMYKLSEFAFKPISVRNELEVLSSIKHICEQHLRNFSENEVSKEERDLLPLFSPERNIATILIGEKEVLLWYIDLVDTILTEWNISKSKTKVSKKIRHLPSTRNYWKLYWQHL